MANEANGTVARRYLLHVWRGVEPKVHGPYATDEERTEAARALAADEDGVFRLDADGAVEVDSFGYSELAKA